MSQEWDLIGQSLPRRLGLSCQDIFSIARRTQPTLGQTQGTFSTPGALAALQNIWMAGPAVESSHPAVRKSGTPDPTMRSTTLRPQWENRMDSLVFDWCFLIISRHAHTQHQLIHAKGACVRRPETRLDGGSGGLVLLWARYLQADTEVTTRLATGATSSVHRTCARSFAASHLLREVHTC